MTATEIREALSERTMPFTDRYDIFREAARAYADLLENGQEVTIEDWVVSGLLADGRYLVVRVEGESS